MNQCRTCTADLAPGKLFCAKCGTPGGATLPMAGPPIHRIKDRYEVLGSLGEGSYGSVFKVRDCQLQSLLRNDPSNKELNKELAGARDCLRALKIPHERVIAEMGPSRFLDEIETLMSLSHPNIATIRDTGLTEDQRPFFTMDYCDGPTLAAEIRKVKRLPLEQFNAIAEGVLDALAYAHKNGVVHRDLKPSNIILSPRGSETVARVVDFGIAKAMQPGKGRTESLRGVPWGSPAYMSPEQVEGGKPTVQTDLYNAGATFYEVLTGQTPFSGEDHSEIYEKVRRDLPKRPRQLRPEIPEHVDRAIMRALAKRPHDRPGSAKQFLEELRPPKAKEWGARIGWAVAALVVIGIAVLLQLLRDKVDPTANALTKKENFFSRQNAWAIADATTPLARLKLPTRDHHGTIQATFTDARLVTPPRNWLVKLSGPLEVDALTLRDLWKHQDGVSAEASLDVEGGEPLEGTYEFWADDKGTRNGFKVVYDHTPPAIALFAVDGAARLRLEPGAARCESSSFQIEVETTDAGDGPDSSSTKVMVLVDGKWKPVSRKIDLAGFSDLSVEVKAEDACGNSSESARVVAPGPKLEWRSPPLDAGTSARTDCSLVFDLVYPRSLTAVELEVQPESGSSTTSQLDGAPGANKTVTAELMPGRNRVRLRAIDAPRGKLGDVALERTIDCGTGLLFGVPAASAAPPKCVADPAFPVACVQGPPGDPAKELLAVEGELDGTPFRRAWSTADLPLTVRLHDLTAATAETAKEGEYVFRRVVPEGVEPQTVRLVLDRTRPRVSVQGSPTRELGQPSDSRRPGLFVFPEREVTIEIRDRPVAAELDPIVDWNGQASALTRTGEGTWLATLTLPETPEGHPLRVADAAGNRVDAELAFVAKPEIGGLRSSEIPDLATRVTSGASWVWSASVDSLPISGHIQHPLGRNVRARRVIRASGSEERRDVVVVSEAPNLASFRFDVARSTQPSSIVIEVDYDDSDLGDAWRVQRELKIDYPGLVFEFDEKTQTFTNRDVSYRLPDRFRIKVLSNDGGRQVYEVWSPVAAESGPGVEMVLAGPGPVVSDLSFPKVPFLIDRYEVTAERLDAYARKIGRALRLRPPDDDKRRPAIGVLFADAGDFALWEGKRLPTEAEWRTAAYWDGTKLRRHPWGDEWSWERVYQRRASTSSPPLITDYSGDRSFCAAMGMASGVLEWIDRGSPGNPRQSVMGYHSMYATSDDPQRVIERNRARYESTQDFAVEDAESPNRQIGFRCVLPLVER